VAGNEQIVVVTQMNDPHADDMILTLDRMGHGAIRLNTDDIPVNTRMSLSFEGSSRAWTGSVEILTNGRVVDADNIRSVWWRRPSQFVLPDDFSRQEREFASKEIDVALRGLWASLECYWVSYPENIRQAAVRGGQLKRAAQLGFEVPRTLVTTDPDEARAFYGACGGRMIYKVMTDPFLGAARVAEEYPEEPVEPVAAYTTLVTETELEQLDTIRLVPCMFQEYVPKQIELRVTVIGDYLFAAEVHSQAHEEEASIDWRYYAADVPYRAATLPDEVSERCLELVRSYGLNFGTLDLILTPDGRYVFLEINPNGQFMFVEKRVPELKMTEALAACLIRGSNS
jgi:glutathione synthase/RimK-type ligase-like ATP-grasp enzyme